MKLAPIVLFVYNRPKHTRQTIAALQNNKLARDSDLIIYSDGQVNGKSNRPVEQVRQYIRTVSGFRTVQLIEREKNWGLADSIIDGVTSIIKQYENIIVLEDDIVTSPYFLEYMNGALHRYRHEPKVMHVSAYVPPLVVDGLPPTFFLRPTTCWGWGTWKSAWVNFDNNSEEIVKKLTPSLKHVFNVNNSYDFYSHIIANQKGRLKTWAIFWYATVFLAGGLSLHPRQSLVQNIGHDASGVHCKQQSCYSTAMTSDPIQSFSTQLEEHIIATKRLENFYKSLRQPLWKRVCKKMLS